MASTINVEPVTNGESSEGGYTLADLKAHGTAESMYMLIDDKVYDITKFMDEHPGGGEVMEAEAGRDATEAFNDVGHSDEARGMLPKMYIGEFKGEKTSKKVKKAVSSTASSASSSSGFPLWVVPAALFAAFVAWRVFYA